MHAYLTDTIYTIVHAHGYMYMYRNVSVNVYMLYACECSTSGTSAECRRIPNAHRVQLSAINQPNNTNLNRPLLTKFNQPEPTLTNLNQPARGIVVAQYPPLSTLHPADRWTAAKKGPRSPGAAIPNHFWSSDKKYSDWSDSSWWYSLMIVVDGSWWWYWWEITVEGSGWW